ncbi:MAG: cache domain-containing protein [Xanthobacteraceae bacterium]|nr:cache domain-containing protein [Xanthobacteraceae bacterium]
MNAPVADGGTLRQPTGAIQYCGFLLRRYACWLTLAVAIVLVASRTIEGWLFDQSQKSLLDRVQQQQTEAAAGRIGLFVKEIEAQMRWLTQVPSNAASLDEWRFESVRVLRQVPAITELARIDSTGREQVWVSRIAADIVGSQTDFSHEPKFVQAMANKHYYSPVYFRRDSEPYMTLAIAGASADHGVVVAEVNLKLIREVISEISATLQRTAFVVDSRGRIIAHPDMSLVLRNTGLSHLAHGEKPPCNGIHQQPLTMNAPVPWLGWTLMLCQPTN